MSLGTGRRKRLQAMSLLVTSLIGATLLPPYAIRDGVKFSVRSTNTSQLGYLDAKRT